MPIYEYQCQECGDEFELFVVNQRAADAATCPKCHSAKIQKKFSAFAASVGKRTGAPASSPASCSGPV